jgi:hypothetical protein
MLFFENARCEHISFFFAAMYLFRACNLNTSYFSS